MALQAMLVEEGQAQGLAQRAKGALASWSPGKRKRGRKKWCLQELASVGLPDEVSCIHLMPYSSGDHLPNPCSLIVCVFWLRSVCKAPTSIGLPVKIACICSSMLCF